MARYALGGREGAVERRVAAEPKKARPSKLGGVELPPLRFSVITYELQN